MMKSNLNFSIEHIIWITFEKEDTIYTEENGET